MPVGQEAVEHFLGNWLHVYGYESLYDAAMTAFDGADAGKKAEIVKLVEGSLWSIDCEEHNPGQDVERVLHMLGLIDLNVMYPPVRIGMPFPVSL